MDEDRLKFGHRVRVKDIDISLEIASLTELEEIRQELRNKGFSQTAEEDVICRFRYRDIKVDVMSTRDIGWAPANIWFEEGFSNFLSRSRRINE